MLIFLCIFLILNLCVFWQLPERNVDLTDFIAKKRSESFFLSAFSQLSQTIFKPCYVDKTIVYAVYLLIHGL